MAKETYQKFEDILEVYLKDLEEARNVQTRADALVTIGEHLRSMNLYAQYKSTVKRIEAKGY
jgi:hypothetical protein